ncbi:unnamed protein product [Parnassius mnemosyne]|uniref:PiggyBac transposable element-derived protein domain-containing protein n=1 Tax=Parnassius mnemosyne TaxID=213953 RepID=A0AAV1L9X8_9NEOP
MPNKPAKYGIKLFSLADATIYYTKKLEIYVGKQLEGSYNLDTSTVALVKRMIKPIAGSGRNATMDNWFTSISLAEQLLTDYNLTVVGTVKKNNPDIPNDFKRICLEEFSCVFGYKQTQTLLSYCPKKDKIVLLLSTMHNYGAVDDSTQKSSRK